MYVRVVPLVLDVTMIVPFRIHHALCFHRVAVVVLVVVLFVVGYAMPWAACHLVLLLRGERHPPYAYRSYNEHPETETCCDAHSFVGFVSSFHH